MSKFHLPSARRYSHGYAESYGGQTPAGPDQCEPLSRPVACRLDGSPLTSQPPQPNSTPSRLFTRAVAGVELATIGVLALLGYLLGATRYDLLTDDEIRYAEAGRQMWRTGDFVVPVYNTEPRFQKPLLVYWLQAISQGLFGSNALAARVPSALAAVVALWSTWSIARTVWDATTARWAVLVLATMLEFVLLARMVLIDMLLVAGLQASVAAILSAWHTRSLTARFLRYQWAGLALGLAISAKGPLAVLLFAFLAVPLILKVSYVQRSQLAPCPEPTQQWNPANGPSWPETGRNDVLSLPKGCGETSSQLGNSGRCRNRCDLLLLLTAGLTAALVGLASYLLPHWRTGGEFTWQFLLAENWQRFTSVINEHPQPLWFYLALLLPLSFPWTGAVPLALHHAWGSAHESRSSGMAALRCYGADHVATCGWRSTFSRALLLQIACVFVFFSLSRTKVWTYTFPAMPSLALLVARWLVCQMREQPSVLRQRLRQAFALGLPICLTAALAVTLWPTHRLPEEVRDAAFLLAVRIWAWLLVAILAMCWWVSRLSASVPAILTTMVCSTVGWYAMAVYYVIPQADRLWNEPVRMLARLWQQYPQAEVITFHVHDLGLNFHAQRDLVHHWRNEALPDLYERLRYPRPVFVLVDKKLVRQLRGLPIHFWDENNRFVLVANFPPPYEDSTAAGVSPPGYSRAVDVSPP